MTFRGTYTTSSGKLGSIPEPVELSESLDTEKTKNEMQSLISATTALDLTKLESDLSVDMSKPAETSFGFYGGVALGGSKIAIRLVSLAPGRMEDNIECTLESISLD